MVNIYDANNNAANFAAMMKRIEAYSDDPPEEGATAGSMRAPATEASVSAVTLKKVGSFSDYARWAFSWTGLTDNPWNIVNRADNLKAFISDPKFDQNYREYCLTKPSLGEVDNKKFITSLQNFNQNGVFNETFDRIATVFEEAFQDANTVTIFPAGEATIPLFLTLDEAQKQMQTGNIQDTLFTNPKYDQKYVSKYLEQWSDSEFSTRNGQTYTLNQICNGEVALSKDILDDIYLAFDEYQNPPLEQIADESAQTQSLTQPEILRNETMRNDPAAIALTKRFPNQVPEMFNLQCRMFVDMESLVEVLCSKFTKKKLTKIMEFYEENSEKPFTVNGKTFRINDIEEGYAELTPEIYKFLSDYLLAIGKGEQPQEGEAASPSIPAFTPLPSESDDDLASIGASSGPREEAPSPSSDFSASPSSFDYVHDRLDAIEVGPEDPDYQQMVAYSKKFPEQDLRMFELQFEIVDSNNFDSLADIITVKYPDKKELIHDFFVSSEVVNYQYGSVITGNYTLNGIREGKIELTPEMLTNIEEMFEVYAGLDQ